MADIKNYVIALNGILAADNATDSATGSAADSAALKSLLEENSNLFAAAALSTYGGDVRYAVIEGSFSITSLTADQISYRWQVNYFAPCHDQNEIFETHGSANYTIANDVLTLTIDETLWNVD